MNNPKFDSRIFKNFRYVIYYHFTGNYWSCHIVNNLKFNILKFPKISGNLYVDLYVDLYVEFCNFSFNLT